jgi:ABC-2 type transport system permease protein
MRSTSGWCGKLLKPLIRGWTLLSKDLTEVLRQPLLVLALVLGPFLILLVSALGHRSQPPTLTAILDLPPSLGLSRDVSAWRDRFGGAVNVVAVTSDEAATRAAVENNQVDLGIIIPSNGLAELSHGNQATITIVHNQINPVDQDYTGFVAYILSSELNKQVIAQVAQRAQQELAKSRAPLAQFRSDVASLPNVPGGSLARITSDLDALDAVSNQLQALAPSLVAAPLKSQVVSVATLDPGYVAFYSPGVLALLLQHLAITFGALSLVRDRVVGITELFKVAPTSTLAILFGKYASYGLLALGVCGVLTELMIRGLNVPLLGDPRLFWATLALVTFASIGVGLTISLLSSSQENAVQLTMLVLLASVFFSGFFVPTKTLQAPASEVGEALPVSHAIAALQDIMLRGRLADFQPLYVLGGMGLFFFLTSTILLNRELRRS